VWCHWCHVMDETTYADAEVGEILRSRFVALRADVDARPDLTERYQDWGWPATILFNGDGQELGKFRGYLSPEEMRTALHNALSSSAAAEEKKPMVRGGLAVQSPSFDALAWIGARVARDLDGRYDDEEGGWGKQKLPIGGNLEME